MWVKINKYPAKLGYAGPRAMLRDPDRGVEMGFWAEYEFITDKGIHWKPTHFVAIPPDPKDEE